MKRRATVNGTRRWAATGGILKGVVEQFVGTIFHETAERMSEGIEDVRVRMVSTLAGAGILVTGLVFLVIAGVKGLESVRLPTGVPEAIGGVLAVGVSWLLLRRSRRS
jgi:hypothetical protein